MTLDAFMELEKDGDVDSKIEAKQEDVELMNSAEPTRSFVALTAPESARRVRFMSNKSAAFSINGDLSTAFRTLVRVGLCC